MKISKKLPDGSRLYLCDPNLNTQCSKIGCAFRKNEYKDILADFYEEDPSEDSHLTNPLYPCYSTRNVRYAMDS